MTASAQLKPDSLARIRADELAVAYSTQNLAFTLPSGFVRPLDSHTCYTPWPVFRDVTDGAGLSATPPGFLVELNFSRRTRKVFSRTCNDRLMIEAVRIRTLDRKQLVARGLNQNSVAARPGRPERLEYT